MQSSHQAKQKSLQGFSELDKTQKEIFMTKSMSKPIFI